MRIHCAATVLLAWVSCGEAIGGDSNSNTVYRPVRVSFEDLLNTNDAESGGRLLDALSEVGMISVTNMPEDFRQSKKETQAWTYPCASVSTATKEHTYPDGTRRRTMATHTVAGPGGTQTIDHGSVEDVSCDAFNQFSAVFRGGVDRVTRAFASRVSVLLKEDKSTPMPLLETEEGFSFHTVREVVDNGDHLEHFHSYQGVSSVTESHEHFDASTIEWHTDQGLFLVFTPGVMTQSAKGLRSKNTVLAATEGFNIELADGSHALVQFDHEDDVVIMLGDGVNQYVNNKGGDPQGRKLRAVPHALVMPKHHFENTARVWYGRMVLPPASAVHPEHGKTFGRLRQLLIEASTSVEEMEDVLALGCSSSSSSYTHARQLEDSSCEEGTLYCWHRCMSLEEAGVSETICAEQGLDLFCINPRRQLWDNTHGDWFPGCIDVATAPNATEYPRLPDYPRDEDACTEEAYGKFVESNSEQYDFKADLMEGGILMWTVDGDKINGMFSYDGLFGFTALGFAGFPGGNAMHGAIIIMATPSESYSPVTGFNYSFEPAVQEYIIHPTEKAFRHWMTPMSSTARATPVSDVTSYAVMETDCFTAMTFNTAGIYNTTFNVTGTDKLIWGANGEDMFAGYHGQSRGVITVEWATGKVTLDEEREALKEGEAGTNHDGHNHEGHDHDHEDGDADKKEGEFDELLESTSGSALVFGLGASLGFFFTSFINFF